MNIVGALPCFSTLSSPIFPRIKPSFLGFHIPKLIVRLPPKSPSLVITSARTESKSVSLGFRAPDFALSEPLTGRHGHCRISKRTPLYWRIAPKVFRKKIHSDTDLYCTFINGPILLVLASAQICQLVSVVFLFLR
ncbi:hypothetical protein RND81_02G083400 [Saponaria officinalis]|uniref:Uncharacterized protein n=1 Tax=Saponaria officinalis TaxID=3572 RepID=A0AAW1MRR5_SAPOF